MTQNILVQVVLPQIPDWNSEYQDASGFECEVNLHDPVTMLIDKLAKKYPDSQAAWSLHCGELVRDAASTDVVLPPPEVVVVSEREGSDRASRKIHINDRFIHYQTLPKRKLEAHLSCPYDGAVHSIAVDKYLTIKFHRTVRLPDDDNCHQLPASFGTFPLYNVAEFASRLPETLVSTGGVFFPMWQREAMWVEFIVGRSAVRPSGIKKYAIRPFVGRINAITGKPMDEPKQPGEQDYIVVPNQRWLDGICTEEGIVRQFVAMPLGSGYTVEGQKTSEEKFGGLQLEIIPAYDNYDFENAADIPNIRITKEKAIGLDPTYDRASLPRHLTPADLKLRDGDEIFLQNPTIELRPATFAPLLDHYIERFNPAPTNREGHGIPVLQLYAYYKPVVRLADIAERSRSYEDEEALGWSLPDGLPLFSSLGGGLHLHSSSDTPELRISHSFSLSDIPERIINEPRKVQAMGLSAGGRLVQDIVRDSLAAWRWDTSNSKLLNIHMLDPASFERVTHILPPPPPIGAKAYANAGYGFWAVEEDVDNRLEGGDFEGIKSVGEMDQEMLANANAGDHDVINPLKPVVCRGCSLRLCDCVLRPCNHQFCNVCILGRDEFKDVSGNRMCPSCSTFVERVVGFSAPMNIPGEEFIDKEVEVTLLKVGDDGRVAFDGVIKTQI